MSLSEPSYDLYSDELGEPGVNWHGGPATLLDMAEAITTIDLFAGAGGLSAGLQKASNRFRPLVAVELDLAAAATYAENHAHTQVINQPIQYWVRTGVVPEADVIVGGPPCQGFSSLGKEDVNDVRNFLWQQYAEVILSARPKYFVIENVAQFLKSQQFTEFESSTRLGGRLSNYDISAHGVLNAAHFGSPQTRRRTVVIGRRHDMPQIYLPPATHQDRTQWATVRQAWTGLPAKVDDTELPDRWVTFQGERLRGAFKSSELHLSRHYTDLSLSRFQEIKEGGNRFDIPDHLLSDCWRRHQTGSGDVMGRLFWNRPSVTIRTEFVKPEKGRYLHPEENRAITLLEGARIQGFDDDYRWCGSKTAIAKQIGNAVPIALGAAIGRQLSQALST